MNPHPAHSPSGGILSLVSRFFRESGMPLEGFELCPIRGDGSQRVFWRVLCPPSGTSYIAMENVPGDDFSRRENEAYLRIGRHLYEKGLPLPRILLSDMRGGRFLMEDLGDTSLQEWASRSHDRKAVYERVVEILYRLQTLGADGFDTAWTCQTRRYDAFVMRRFEAEYFRDAFLKGYLGLGGEWPELDGPFDHLAEKASRADNRFFLHRDFQSRNIMISGDRLGIIDWQGGRLGPLAYDLASLLIDPYTSLSREEKEGLFDVYLDCLRGTGPGAADAFQRDYPYLAVQRNLQILGAFAFLSRVRGKTYFEVYIPPALESLHSLLETLGDPGLIPLKQLVDSLMKDGPGPPAV